MTLYIVLAAVGFGLMLVSFLADDILEGFLDIDSGGLFSTTALAAALTLFGAGGIIATAVGADERWSIPVAAVAGAASVAFVRALRSSESPQPDLAASVVGTHTVVEAGPSVLVLFNGAYLRLAVRSQDGEPLRTGQNVRVVSLMSPGRAVVVPVPPMNAKESNS